MNEIEIVNDRPSIRQVAEVHDTGINEIVVAVDLTPHCRKTVAYAAEFARPFGATITLVHAFSPEEINQFNTSEAHESLEVVRGEAEHELLELVDEVREVYLNCNMEFRIGEPAEQVTQMASTLNADLIIVASHHASFLTRLFGSEQAPKILHRAPCPVLVYRDGVSS